MEISSGLRFARSGVTLVRAGVFLGKFHGLLAEEAIKAGVAEASTHTRSGHVCVLNVTGKLPWESEKWPRITSGWGATETAAATEVSRNSAERKRLEANATGSHTQEEWKAIVDRSGNTCLCCGVSGEHVGLTKDHVLPLEQGGTNYASNLQSLCRSCNSRKGNREIDYRRQTVSKVA